MSYDNFETFLTITELVKTMPSLCVKCLMTLFVMTLGVDPSRLLRLQSSTQTLTWQEFELFTISKNVTATEIFLFIILTLFSTYIPPAVYEYVRQNAMRC